MDTHLPQSEGKNQSGDVENEVFEPFGLPFNFHMIKGQKVRSIIVIVKLCLMVS